MQFKKFGKMEHNFFKLNNIFKIIIYFSIKKIMPTIPILDIYYFILFPQQRLDSHTFNMHFQIVKHEYSF